MEELWHEDKSKNDDLLMEDELAAAFLSDDSVADDGVTARRGNNMKTNKQQPDEQTKLPSTPMRQRPRLVIKARTAGESEQSDLDVSISDGF